MYRDVQRIVVADLIGENLRATALNFVPTLVTVSFLCLSHPKTFLKMIPKC